MASEGPPPKKQALDTGQGLGQGSSSSQDTDRSLESSLLDSVSLIHQKLELCLSHSCLCSVQENEVQTYVSLCQTRLPTTLLSIVAGDSSVLLDFLVSNETCFLLYLLRLLKFFLRDWSSFMEAIEDTYGDAVRVLLELKSSIARLLSKSLFPYNIGPVFRLLERVEAQHATVQQLSWHITTADEGSIADISRQQ